MNSSVAGFLYLGAAIAFIVGIKRLASPATARRGNQYAALGMLVAVIVTLVDRDIIGYGAIAAGMLVGGGIGAFLARSVEMTAMPQLVAAFNGFGGGSSALVALAELTGSGGFATRTLVSAGISIFIGALTLSGSFVAFGKLQGIIDGRAIVTPGQKAIDPLLVVAAIVMGVTLVVSPGLTTAWVLAGLAAVLGVTRTLPIGGADMPVVISFLNSASGIAAAAAGFVIDSNALIISGALVGASGLILTNIMVKAMNRTLIAVLFQAFGPSAGSSAEVGSDDRIARRGSPEDVAVMLAYADRVIIVPGYGLAVAQAQHTIRELAALLESRGVQVHYAIHPVAGRMPGHMNVLLAEADIDYDLLYDLEDINPEFPSTDVTLVVGANDVVNPLARTDQESPIFGMPILDADRSNMVVVVKRSLSPGYAGIDNPLFYEDNTLMLFADAKQGLSEVVTSIKEL